MKKSDFIYHFTDIYLSEAVKETILIENWEEKDFDTRYVEYIDMFTRLKKECLVENVSDAEIIHRFRKERANIVQKFNETISGHFVKALNKHGSSTQVAQHFVEKEIPLNGDTINPDILKTFRIFEEQVVE